MHLSNRIHKRGVISNVCQPSLFLDLMGQAQVYGIQGACIAILLLFMQQHKPGIITQLLPLKLAIVAYQDLTV